jgi:hypothetical protein
MTASASARAALSAALREDGDHALERRGLGAQDLQQKAGGAVLGLKGPPLNNRISLGSWPGPSVNAPGPEVRLGGGEEPARAGAAICESYRRARQICAREGVARSAAARMLIEKGLEK